jgi:DNA topoisomerase IA
MCWAYQRSWEEINSSFSSCFKICYSRIKSQVGPSRVCLLVSTHETFLILSCSVADVGIDVNDNFKPYYQIMEKKIPLIAKMKEILKSCDEILLATDEDREGEAISWHLLELLKPTIPFRRAVFHEITEKAILDSFANPRDLNYDIVASQEARRMLDRLVGFTLSPLLWKFVGPNLSAGRVQSCGLYLCVEVGSLPPSVHLSLSHSYSL